MSLLLILFAAFEYSIPSGSAGALLAGTAVSSGGGAMAFNPALLGVLPANSVNLTYCQPFGISEIQYGQADVELRRLGLGGRVSALGFGSYQEFTGSLAKAFKLPYEFTFGAGVNLYSFAIGAAQREIIPALDVGACWSRPRVSLGAAIQNLNHPALSNGDAIPLRFRLGASVIPGSELQLAADWEREENASGFRFGASFRIHPALTLALGIGTAPLQYAGGVTCAYRGLGISYVYAFNPRLKQTQILGVGYGF
jgi:hypothetical protein